MALFLSIVLSIWSAMHLYVFWRLASVPCVAAHVARPVIIGVAVILWLSYPAARFMESRRLHGIARPVEFLGAMWIGLLFLLFAGLLLVEAITLGGWLFPDLAPRMRGWASLASCALAVIALIQGLRPPVVSEYGVVLAGLPPKHDGLVLAQISDLHLGTLIGRDWLTRLVRRVNALRPDLVAVVGDVVDGNVGRVGALRSALAELRAPLGVWAVTGNHEYYAGVERCVSLLREARFKVLRDSHEEVTPGLFLAGVDDLTARQQFGHKDHPVEKALSNRPAGATILLSHSPWQAELAAGLGAGLMLSGHTHNGQIWPFSYLVRLRYPLVSGRHEVKGMSVIVCRGTGTWGPRMRLWRPGEIVKIRLRSPLQGA